MDKTSVFDIIFNNDDQNESGDGISGKGFFSRELSGSMTKKFKRLLSKPVFKMGRSIAYFLSHISARVYGSMFFTFGLFSIILFLLGFSHDSGILTPIIGGALCLVSIPFLLFDKTLPMLLQDFVLTDYIFFEFFCMNRHNAIEGQKRCPVFLAILVGLIPAGLSTVLPLWQIALVICVAIMVYLGMESPEFIFLLSLFLLPYLKYINYGETCLWFATLITILSFIRKVAYGKRVINIEQYDIFLALMMIFVLISGIFIKGLESFSGSLEMIVLAGGYLLAGNIITNRRLAERVANTIVVSGAFAAIVSIVQLVVLLFKKAGSFEVADLSVVLARKDGMAVFFIAAVVFAVGMINQSKRLERINYIFFASVSLVALIITGEFFAVAALLVGIATYFIIKSNKFLWVLPMLVFVPLLILVLPNSFLNILFYYSPSIASAEELFGLWRNSLIVFINNFFVGIGIGSDSFAREMADLGIFGYSDSSNLLIEISLEAGVFALLCFLAMVVTRIRHRSIQRIYVRNSQIETMVGVSGVCLFCLICFGMINYIWSDDAAYFLFWCIFGMGSASLRVAKKDYNDKVLYYEEYSDLDSSVIDIEIG